MRWMTPLLAHSRKHFKLTFCVSASATAARFVLPRMSRLHGRTRQHHRQTHSTSQFVLTTFPQPQTNLHPPCIRIIERRLPRLNRESHNGSPQFGVKVFDVHCVILEKAQRASHIRNPNTTVTSIRNMFRHSVLEPLIKQAFWHLQHGVEVGMILNHVERPAREQCSVICKLRQQCDELC